MHGYMLKLGNPFLTQWQRRYFYLFPNRLEWRGEGESRVSVKPMLNVTCSFGQHHHVLWGSLLNALSWLSPAVIGFQCSNDQTLVSRKDYGGSESKCVQFREVHRKASSGKQWILVALISTILKKWTWSSLHNQKTWLPFIPHVLFAREIHGKFCSSPSPLVKASSIHSIPSLQNPKTCPPRRAPPVKHGLYFGREEDFRLHKTQWFPILDT